MIRSLLVAATACSVSLPAGIVAFRLSSDPNEPGIAREASPDRRTESPHPAITWPVQRTYRRLYPDRVAVLESESDLLEVSHHGTLLTYSGERLELLDAAIGKALWPEPVACRAQPVLLGVVAGRSILATPHRVFALSNSDGRVAWSFGRRPPDDPQADPESVAVAVACFLTDRHVYRASNRGDLLCIDAITGDIVWTAQSEASSDCILAANARHLARVTRQGAHTALDIFDVATGRPIPSTELDNGNRAQSMFLADLDLLVVTTSKAILGIDLATGDSRWRVQTPHLFVASTLLTSADALIVSTDGRTLTQYDLADGKPLWQTSTINDPPEQILWTELAGGTVYLATANRLTALRASDGQRIWHAEDPPTIEHQAPRLTKTDIICIEPEPSDAKRRRRERAGATSRHDAAKTRYRIRRFDRATGRERPVTDDGPLVTEPLTSFGGLVLRDGCLVVLDGNRLIGYVARGAPTTRPPR